MSEINANKWWFIINSKAAYPPGMFHRHLWLYWLRSAHTNFLVLKKEWFSFQNIIYRKIKWLQAIKSLFKKIFWKNILFKTKLLINCFQRRPIGSSLEICYLAKACWAELQELHRYTNSAHSSGKKHNFAKVLQ